MEARLWRLESVQFPQRNFALGGDGALIYKAFTSPTVLPPNDQRRRPQMPPTVILDDSTAVGRCWEFEGSQGHVGVGLTEMANISSLSLNHAHPRLVSLTSSKQAPREFRLWGLYPPQQWLDTTQHRVEMRPASHFLLSRPFPAPLSPGHHFVLLVNSTYYTSLPFTRQTFKVPPFLKTTLSAPADFVVFESLSNWGARTTCLYSIEIHGEPAV